MLAGNSNLRKGACLEKNWPFELDRVNDQPTRACFDEAVETSVDFAPDAPRARSSERAFETSRPHCQLVPCTVHFKSN